MILASLGLGSVGLAFVSKIAPYKSVFVILTGLMLFGAYTIMEKRNVGKPSKIIFWSSAVISIVVLYYPTIVGLLR